MKDEKVIVFDIQARHGHFRKFFSNSSSLTYLIPPRTTIAGMIASIMGYPRDSYYETLHYNKSKIGVKILEPPVTTIQCMNYYHSDSKNQHIQIRLQLLSPKNNCIKYRIYFSHEDQEVMRKLEYRLREGILGYGISFGQKQFKGSAELIEVTTIQKVLENYKGEVSTLTLQENFQPEFKRGISLASDIMPNAFHKANNGRKREKNINVYYEKNGKSISGTFKKAFALNNGDYITFFNSGRSD